MYRWMIIDDEPVICHGMQTIVELLSLPELEPTGQIVTDAMQALELAKETEPDIVITDIRMPDMDGLELIRQFKKSGRKSQFILLSGYEDFTYAQQAVKLGAVDYLLKPADEDEVRRALCKSIESLNMSRQFSGGLNSLLFNQAGPEWQGSGESDPMLADINCICTVLFSKPVEPLYAAELRRMMVGVFSQHGFPKWQSAQRSTQIALAGHACPDGLMPAAQAVQDEIICRTDSKAVTVFGSRQSDETLPQLLNRCIEHSVVALYAGNTRAFACPAGNWSKSRLNTLRPILQELDTGLGLAESGIVRKATATLLHQAAEMMFSGREFSQLYNAITTRMLETAAKTSEVPSVELPFRQLGSFASIEDLTSYLFEQLNLILSANRLLRDDSVIDLAIKYIHANYSSDISLTVLSNKASMNYSYFSRLFKEKTGQTFVDYLMQVRMMAAREMLASPLSRVNEVAMSVGYADAQHFSRAFKAFTGLSPSEYRKGN